MKCTGTNANGIDCRANAMIGQDKCFFHHAATAEQRIQARHAGGVTRPSRRNVARAGTTLTTGAPGMDWPLASSADAGALIEQTINQVIQGGLDPRVANSVGYLTSVLNRLRKMSDLEREIAELKEQLKQQKQAG